MDNLHDTESSSEVIRYSKAEIYQILRKRICLLNYTPGSRLNERDLAQEFGISRTPLRSVLQRLENDGFIISQHGLGTIVAPIDLQSMRDIYVVRMHLMDAVADSTPVDIDGSKLEMVEQLTDRCRQLRTAPDKEEFARIIIRLHEILHGLVRNQILREFNDTLFYQSARFWFLLLDDINFEAQIDELQHEMELLYRSLELGDIKLTASIHKAHLGLVLAHLNKAK
ncbi:putative HTH-type transcriptional regulator YdfH [Roseovarius albus]|uniref:Putative HTH-type transcriptional regulator YdfH n=1 Tax=Roseovarius albus TaxID=1247867 RepID=A0A1X7A4E4_9RHOB|nr:GntR family transcriptional regulator [Roseovarius albus]SLN69922.1 putative HTH-type transcriptional regulator YdfH [Roseovarius albus]